MVTAIQLFKQKNEYMSQYYSEVSANELYHDIFPAELLEKKGDKSHRASNPIFTYKESKTSDDGTKKTYFRNEIVFADAFDDSLAKTQKNECALCSLISYSGRNKTAKNAYKCYGFIIDLDGVGMEELRNFWGWVQELEEIPCPTYLISSGHGLHVYYVFENPVPLYPNVVSRLQSLKKGLTYCVWNKETSNYEPTERQFQGIFQNYRMVGSCSKLGKGAARAKYTIKGWKTGHRYSFEELNRYVTEEYRVPENPDYASWEWADEGHYALTECKEMFPEWYERRIVKKEPPSQWKCYKGLYDWWLRTIQEKGNAIDGNRYHCISVLYIYAIKCMIPKELVDADAYGLIEQFNELTVKPDNEFTVKDIKAASKYYDPKYHKVSTRYIKEKTQIKIPENKRRKKTLKRDDGTAYAAARSIQNLRDPDGEWRNKDGAPKKQRIVYEWRKQHPQGRKVDCIRDTGLSKPTVYKWWGKEKIE